MLEASGLGSAEKVSNLNSSASARTDATDVDGAGAQEVPTGLLAHARTKRAPAASGAAAQCVQRCSATTAREVLPQAVTSMMMQPYTHAYSRQKTGTRAGRRASARASLFVDESALKAGR